MSDSVREAAPLSRALTSAFGPVGGMAVLTLLTLAAFGPLAGTGVPVERRWPDETPDWYATTLRTCVYLGPAVRFALVGIRNFTHLLWPPASTVRRAGDRGFTYRRAPTGGVYLVEVKPSARKANGPAGRAVVEGGGRRAFADRAAAEAWAEALSDRGDRPVWIRTAHPADASGVDAYLVSRQRQLLDLDGAHDKRRRRLRGETSERGTLAAYEP